MASVEKVLEQIGLFQMPTHRQTKSVFKLDPKSDRYRICPQCNRGHMVKHRGRDFCSEKCCDDYNNQNKRLLKQSEQVLPVEKAAVIENDMIVIQDEKPKAVSASLETSKGKQKNIQILDALPIDPKEGTCFYLKDLIEMGISFRECSIEKLHNIPTIYQANCLIAGQYKMYLIENEKILIAK